MPPFLLASKKLKRALRWLLYGVAGLLGLVAVAVLVVYGVSEVAIRRTHDAVGTPVTVPSDAASIAEGERLARIRGCTGCHGSKLEGQMFVDHPLLGRVASPNLTVAAREYSDAELERIIRHGIRPNNRSVIGMPSEMFSVLDDSDMGKILAYIHSAPQVAGQTRIVKLGPAGRLGVALKKFQPAAEEVKRARTLASVFPVAGDSTARGAYLARTSCTECHGLDLSGGDGIPDLRIAAGYTNDQFVRLMRTGIALGERDVRLMSSVARDRFSHFTDEEISALYAYLLSRARGGGPRPQSATSRPVSL